MQRIFPRALVACMSEARPPRADEIEVMATKIWREAFAPRSGCQWSQVPYGSKEYRCVMAAVAAALGCWHLDRSGYPQRLAA